MITNLPADFLVELKKFSRKPVQLCTFLINGTKYYLSDFPITIDGNKYEPWVESWGEIVDNSDIESLFGGQSIGIRTCNIVLFNSSLTYSFIQKLFGSGVENTRVDLYQWFQGMTSPPVLIDEFVCQNPISISENSMLVKIDLVSPLAASNRRIFPIKAGDKQYPVIVGRVSGVPLIDLETGQYVVLGEDLAFDRLGTINFDNTGKLPSSGTIIIDEEQISYTTRTDTTLNITARGTGGTTALPHSAGSISVLLGTSFQYAVCGGPVSAIDSVVAGGSAVAGWVAQPAGNPATVTFSQWPPNIGIGVGLAPVNQNLTRINEVPYNHTNNINYPLTYSQTVDNDFPVGGHSIAGGYFYDVSPPVSAPSYKVKVKMFYRVSVLATDAKFRIDFGYSTHLTPSDTDVIGIVSTEITEVQTTWVEVLVDCGVISHDELVGIGTPYWRFAFLIELFGASGSIFIMHPQFIIETNYTEQISPEGKQRTFISEPVTCTVTAGHGVDVTPPVLVRNIIENNTDYGYQIDTTDFDNEHNRYNAAGYYFNGMLPAGIRTQELIKIALLEGLARLKYNQGKIQFLSYFDDDLESVDKEINLDHIRIRGRYIEHYSSGNIKNDITVKYAYDLLTGDYTGTINKTDADSIAKYTLKDDERDLILVSSASVATLHAERMLKFLKDSPEVFNVDIFLPEGYELEKGDRVALPDFLDKRKLLFGNILSMTRTIGQGKTGLINSFQVMLTNLDYILLMRLEEELILDDSLLGFSQSMELFERLGIDDRKLLSARKIVYTLTEQLVLDDSALYAGTNLTLVLPTEQVILDSTDIKLTVCGGYGDCGYGEKGYGE